MTKSWLTELEGLRGLAALWVFASHVSIMSGAHIPIISWGALGVDLFILLSGFLMVHQYEQRKAERPWTEVRTIGVFWSRRFFRIAPLYYLLLTVSFAVDPLLSWSRLSIGQHYPGSMTNVLRYTDRSLANVLTHFSFVFGFLPHFSFQTALPDWSIGLEMQFYFVFPFLMLAVRRFGYVAMAVGTLVLTLCANAAFLGFFRSFPMASFLPLKINLFLLGMLIAAAFHKRYVYHVSIFVILFPLISFFVTPQQGKLGVLAEIALAGVLLSLTATSESRHSALAPLRWILNGRVTQILGNMSYSLYLVHLLLVMPVCAALLHVHRVASLPAIPRYCFFFAASALFVFPISTLLYYGVERPGIKLGQRLTARKAAAFEYVEHANLTIS
jgi:peptidoglycan/LPS O-acetylase OafA/YrhL